jgi:hypothetical protein
MYSKIKPVIVSFFNLNYVFAYECVVGQACNMATVFSEAGVGNNEFIISI